MTLISSLRRKRSILDLEIFQMPRAHEIRSPWTHLKEWVGCTFLLPEKITTLCNQPFSNVYFVPQLAETSTRTGVSIHTPHD